MMELKTRCFSYEFNGIRIKFMLEDLAAKFRSRSKPESTKTNCEVNHGNHL